MLPLPLLLLPLPLAQDPAPPVREQDPDAVLREALLADLAEDSGDPFPLRIEDVARYVQENAPALEQARLRALAAEGGSLEAAGAFDTVLFADATYSYLEQPSSGFFTGFGDTKSRRLDANEGIRTQLMTGGSFEMSLTQNYLDANYVDPAQADAGFGFSFTQPLLRGGWELSATRDLRRAEMNWDRSRATLRRSNVEAVQQAIDAYWELAFTLADVQVKRDSLLLAVELRDMTQVRYEVGAVAEVEVVQAEADIATRTDALLAARNAVRGAADNLRILLFGLEDDDEWDWQLLPRTEPPEPEDEEPGWEEVFESAREYRADLRELRADVLMARLDWDAARHDMMPKLDFIAGANLYAQETKLLDATVDLFDMDFPGYNLGLVFEMPLGDRLYTGAERRTRFEYQLALRTLRDTENTVANEVREAVRELSFQARRVAVTRQSREVAARQLEAEERRLQEGASTNFQVLQFQTDLAAAESAAVRARMDYAKAVTRLNTVRGLNWDGSTPDLPDLEDYRPGVELRSGG